MGRDFAAHFGSAAKGQIAGMHGIPQTFLWGSTPAEWTAKNRGHLSPLFVPTRRAKASAGPKLNCYLRDERRLTFSQDTTAGQENALNCLDFKAVRRLTNDVDWHFLAAVPTIDYKIATHATILCPTNE
jgi:hypothetical protein